MFIHYELTDESTDDFPKGLTFFFKEGHYVIFEFKILFFKENRRIYFIMSNSGNKNYTNYTEYTKNGQGLYMGDINNLIESIEENHDSLRFYVDKNFRFEYFADDDPTLIFGTDDNNSEHPDITFNILINDENKFQIIETLKNLKEDLQEYADNDEMDFFT
jgi:hypothetical protein